MKKRKKIIIFVLVTMVVGIAIFLRITFLWNGEFFENVIYKSRNLIIQQVQEGNRDLIILGMGGSLSVDEQNKIVHHDPLMVIPAIEFQGKTVLSVFYPFETGGLEDSGKELSAYINSIAPDYDSITLIGHSKCGACFANAAKWIEQKETLTVVTISTPFHGTTAADKDAMFEKLNWFEYGAFMMIFSNHKVDQDLIPDSEFIKNADYSGLEDCRHLNIISTCPPKNESFTGFLLKCLDKRGEINGDGIVPEASQNLSYSNTITKKIEATHDNSLEMGIKIAKKIMLD